MSQTKRLTANEKIEIVREAAQEISTADLSDRFGISQRAIQYRFKADAERKKDSASATATVTVKLTPEELEALDAVDAVTGEMFQDG